MGRIALLVFAVMLGSLLGRARAETGAVMVGGKSPPHEKSIAIKAVRDALRVGGTELVNRSFTAKDLDTVTGCIKTQPTWPCVESALRDARIRRVAVVSVDPHEGRTVKITQRMLIARTDSVVSGQRYCEQCTDDTLAQNSAELTKELLDRVAIESGRTVLVVKSSPQGAHVLLDGSSIGATDLRSDIAPGHHSIAIERDGYVPVMRTIDAAEGRTSEIVVTLVPASPPPASEKIRPPKRPPEPSRLAPKLVALLGAVAVAAGVVVFAVDEDAVTSPTQEPSRTYTDTAKIGVGVIGAGAVIGVVGGYYWWKARRSSGVATVAPTAGGAVVGWVKAF